MLPHDPGMSSHALCEKAFPDLPIISYKRQKNLRDILVRAQIKPEKTQPENTTYTCQPCNKARCKTCQHIITTHTFTSYTTKQSYVIKHDSNCKTSNVVYLIQCTKCGLQYVCTLCSDHYFDKNLQYLRMNDPYFSFL